MTPNLEAAHERLRRAALTLGEAEPSVDLAPVAEAIAAALTSVYDAFDGRREAATALHAARERSLAALEALSAEGQAPYAIAARACLERAVEHLDHAADRAHTEPLLAPALPDLLASIDVPRLCALDRPSLAPDIVVPKARLARRDRRRPEPPPAPSTFEDLKGAVAALKARAKPPSPTPKATKAAKPEAAPSDPPPPGFVRTLPRVVSEDAFVRDRARELFEEIAMVGIQRAPLPGEPWRSVRGLEQRLLAAMDAIVAMGHAAIRHLPSFVSGAPARDPSRAFALGVALGSVRGRDTLALVEHALLSCEQDTMIADAIGAALALVPHPHLPLALGTLQKDLSPIVRATAVEVLVRRGLATTEDLWAAAHDEPQVAARALIPLACARARRPMTSLLTAAIQGDDKPLRTSALIAAALTGDPLLRDGVMERLHEADAATGVAIAGIEPWDGARALAERAFASPSPSLIHALGWAGLGSFIPGLVALLDSPEEAIRVAAGGALERITGARLLEQVEAGDDEIAIAEPALPDVGERQPPTLALALSDPRDVPEPPAPEYLVRPSTDPSRWRAYLREHAFAREARYRRGAPHAPRVVLDELDKGLCSPAERTWLVRELYAITGRPIRLDPRDWVPEQEQAIAAYRSSL